MKGRNISKYTSQKFKKIIQKIEGNSPSIKIVDKQLSEKRWKKLFSAIKANTALHLLILSNTNLADFKNNFADLSQSLENKNINYLDLSRNINMDDKDMFILGSLITKNLEYLNLSGLRISGAGIVQFANGMKETNDLSFCLNLSNNQISNKDGELNYLLKLDCLYSLDLSKNKINNMGLYLFSKSLKASPSLKSLNLSQCPFIVPHSIKGLPSSKFISSSKFKKDKENGFKELCNALVKLEIINLNLSYTGLTDKELTLLSPYFSKYSKEPKLVNLSKNSLQMVDKIEEIEIEYKKWHIEELDLSGNNTKYTYEWLEGIGIDIDTEEDYYLLEGDKFKEYLISNPYIKCLKINDINLGTHGLNFIYDVFKARSPSEDYLKIETNKELAFIDDENQYVLAKNKVSSILRQIKKNDNQSIDLVYVGKKHQEISAKKIKKIKEYFNNTFLPLAMVILQFSYTNRKGVSQLPIEIWDNILLKILEMKNLSQWIKPNYLENLRDNMNNTFDYILLKNKNKDNDKKYFYKYLYLFTTKINTISNHSLLESSFDNKNLEKISKKEKKNNKKVWNEWKMFNKNNDPDNYDPDKDGQKKDSKFQIK